MEQNKVTDDWLYQNMPLADEAIIKELEQTTDYEYQFSDKFEHKMEKLIWREAHPAMDAFFRLSKYAAVFLFCVTGYLFLLKASIEANRMKCFETMQIILEDPQEDLIYGVSERNRIISLYGFSIAYEK
ncbi:MAG: hypothetical protein NC094_11620 [Bacteroidales bacterium]|nr:hypothetical protein [Lachnoclostridium sp.]MCM1385089.1 hypothetical protein [Lachnoclostridium sp.]MCM1466056.1 hypothetical protein [Bacteroidales bacterium]